MRHRRRERERAPPRGLARVPRSRVPAGKEEAAWVIKARTLALAALPRRAFRSVAGLMDAMRALVAGNPRLFDAWNRQKFPILTHVLVAWARSEDIGERLAYRIVREAHRTLSAGPEIRSERPWMAAVALRGRAEILNRERPLGEPLPADFRDRAGEPIDEMARQEDRERVRRAIEILPTNYRDALRLRYILDLSEAEVAAHFKARRGIGLPATRWLLKEARAMVKLILGGGDPRTAFPARYARGQRKSANPPSKPIPPPPF